MKMKMSKALHAKLDAVKKTDEFWIDSAKLDFALLIEDRRKQIGKSYADLADILNTSSAYISKIFRGDANLTIESMVKLSRSVGCNLEFSLKEIETNSSHKRMMAKHIENAASQDMEELQWMKDIKYCSDSSPFSAVNDSNNNYQHAA